VNSGSSRQPRSRDQDDAGEQHQQHLADNEIARPNQDIAIHDVLEELRVDLDARSPVTDRCRMIVGDADRGRPDEDEFALNNARRDPAGENIGCRYCGESQEF
jgi:hypothetical protein